MTQPLDEGKTTLMIKNIPNKYTQEMMLIAIDKNFKDSYDFFYLPIDFKVRRADQNNCNIGYAFINFHSAQFIKPFVKEFDGKKWQLCAVSQKVCKIRYARLQGIKALTEHFKEARVMMSHNVAASNRRAR